MEEPSSRTIDAGGPADTLAAIRRLEDLDCQPAVARGIVRRAIAHLERSLCTHLTGPPKAAS